VKRFEEFFQQGIHKVIHSFCGNLLWNGIWKGGFCANDSQQRTSVSALCFPCNMKFRMLTQWQPEQGLIHIVGSAFSSLSEIT